MDENIIVFPKTPKGGPKTVEQVRENLMLQHFEMIEEITDEAAASVLNTINGCGININNQYDIGFIIESIRSALMREAGYDNPVQSMADKMVVVTNEKGQKVFANGHVLGTENS